VYYDPIALEALAELRSGQRALDDFTVEGFADYADALRGADPHFEALAKALSLAVEYVKLPSGLYGLRGPGVILVGLMKSGERREVVGSHECCHHLARLSKQRHHHADVWAMTIATVAPRRRLLELRGTVESPGDLAAACGIPWWTAELRLENPLVRRWLGGYERIRTQLY